MAEGCHHNTVVVPTQADTLLTSSFNCKLVKDATEGSGVFTRTSPLWHLVTTLRFASEACICSSPQFIYPRGLIFCSQLLNTNQIHSRKSVHTPSPIKGCSSQKCKAARLCSFLVTVRLCHCHCCARLSWPGWWGSDTDIHRLALPEFTEAHESAWWASQVAMRRNNSNPKTKSSFPVFPWRADNFSGCLTHIWAALKHTVPSNGTICGKIHLTLERWICSEMLNKWMFLSCYCVRMAWNELFILLIPIVTNLGKSARANMKQHTYAETEHSKPSLRCPLSAHNCTQSHHGPWLCPTYEKCISDTWVRQKKKKKKNCMKKRKYKK